MSVVPYTFSQSAPPVVCIFVSPLYRSIDRIATTSHSRTVRIDRSVVVKDRFMRSLIYSEVFHLRWFSLCCYRYRKIPLSYRIEIELIITALFNRISSYIKYIIIYIFSCTSVKSETSIYLFRTISYAIFFFISLYVLSLSFTVIKCIGRLIERQWCNFYTLRQVEFQIIYFIREKSWKSN